MLHTVIFIFHTSVEIINQPGEMNSSATTTQQSLFAELQSSNNTEGFEPMRGIVIM